MMLLQNIQIFRKGAVVFVFQKEKNCNPENNASEFKYILSGSAAFLPSEEFQSQVPQAPFVKFVVYDMPLVYVPSPHL